MIVPVPHRVRNRQRNVFATFAFGLLACGVFFICGARDKRGRTPRKSNHRRNVRESDTATLRRFTIVHWGGFAHGESVSQSPATMPRTTLELCPCPLLGCWRSRLSDGPRSRRPDEPSAPGRFGARTRQRARDVGGAGIDLGSTTVDGD